MQKGLVSANMLDNCSHITNFVMLEDFDEDTNRYISGFF
jgi:hypothetical protein